jgi:hypothetical protein
MPPFYSNGQDYNSGTYNRDDVGKRWLRDRLSPTYNTQPGSIIDAKVALQGYALMNVNGGINNQLWIPISVIDVPEISFAWFTSYMRQTTPIRYVAPGIAPGPAPKPAPRVKVAATLCECGACHTGAADHTPVHSRWCPAYSANKTQGG